MQQSLLIENCRKKKGCRDPAAQEWESNLAGIAAYEESRGEDWGGSGLALGRIQEVDISPRLLPLTLSSAPTLCSLSTSLLCLLRSVHHSLPYTICPTLSALHPAPCSLSPILLPLHFAR